MFSHVCVLIVSFIIHVKVCISKMVGLFAISYNYVAISLYVEVIRR